MATVKPFETRAVTQGYKYTLDLSRFSWIHTVQMSHSDTDLSFSPYNSLLTSMWSYLNGSQQCYNQDIQASYWLTGCMSGIFRMTCTFIKAPWEESGSKVSAFISFCPSVPSFSCLWWSKSEEWVTVCFGDPPPLSLSYIHKPLTVEDIVWDTMEPPVLSNNHLFLLTLSAVDTYMQTQKKQEASH